MNETFAKIITAIKKYKLALIAAVVVLVLVIGGIVGYNAYQDYVEYHATYIVIDEAEYLRSSTTLDLSGKKLTEPEKLQELTGLKELDLRNTGITADQYDDLRAALPDCYIRWSVPFQGGYLDNEVTTIRLNSLSEADLEMLDYLPNLDVINADGCQDYDVLQLMSQQHPDYTISYSVGLGDQKYYNNATALNVSDPDVDEMMKRLALLPEVETVNLTGSLPSNDELMTLVEAFPEITFAWEFNMFGITVSSTTEFVDLSGMTFASTEEVEAFLPYFYNLTQVDMLNCGFSNTEMDQLNKRHPDTKFVWNVSVCGVDIRTDATYFMPVKHKLKKVTNGGLDNLRYCTDMKAIDLGHYGVSNVSYVEYMPNLEFLLLCECYVKDVTPIGKCTSLKVLELFMNNVTDFWPLVNLTNLEDLNLAQTPAISFSPHKRGTFGESEPLRQMVWLDRLWLASTHLPAAVKTSLKEALPNTVIVTNGANLDCTGRGWRMTPNYFEMRDVVEMWYMAH